MNKNENHNTIQLRFNENFKKSFMVKQQLDNFIKRGLIECECGDLDSLSNVWQQMRRRQMRREWRRRR